MEKLFYQVLLFIWRGIVGLCVGSYFLNIITDNVGSLHFVSNMIIVLIIPIIILVILFFIRKLNPIGYLGVVLMFWVANNILFNHNQIVDSLIPFFGALTLYIDFMLYYAWFIFTAQYFFSNNPQKWGENINQVENKSV